MFTHILAFASGCACTLAVLAVAAWVAMRHAHAELDEPTELGRPS